MNEQLQSVRTRLKKASLTRGELASIAQGSGVSSRTIYNLMNTENKPNLATLDKLLAYFKKQDKKAAKLKTSGVVMSGCTEFGVLVAADFDVKVEFTFYPGEPGKLDGPMEDAVESVAQNIEVMAIKADAAVHFDGTGLSATAERGTDLLPLFTSREIGEIEDRILAVKRAEVD